MNRHTNLQLKTHTNLYFNIISILTSHGFKHKANYATIYTNLYDALKKAIINESLTLNVKLPPSRVLANDLKISRSTVIKAYDLLVLEKYIKSVPGSGYFVSYNKQELTDLPRKKIKHRGKYPTISKRGKHFIKNFQIINSSTHQGIAFRPGLPPLDIFPVQQWKNVSNEYWRTVKPSELSYGPTHGLESLRENIAVYLKIYRNINCEANQIIITSGSLHSLSLISNALIDKKDEVAIENPTYPHAVNLFRSLQAKIAPLHIDSEGIAIQTCRSRKPKLIYTTPSNQYPTGIKMSLKRRRDLLQWVSKKNSLIIEDDYDHEFSNWENPISSIYSLDREDRVIYLGTFNKLLHPSIRLGYMIVPNYLIDTISALYEQSSRFVPPSMQKTLSTFIERDYLNKHLRNVIEVSKERKELFFDHFKFTFNNEIELDSTNTGLHLIARLKKQVNDRKFADFLGQNEIVAHPFSDYFIDGPTKNGLIMGYSSVNNKMIKETITKMGKVYGRFLKENGVGG